MHLKRLELNGFKSFAKKSEFVFDVPIIAIVGPNGSGKSNVVESIRFVLGEQSVKSMRGKTGSDLIFKGSKDIAKMSRASVSITFDNTDRVFYIHESNNDKISVDFDEVTISREVFTDGSNTYRINGTEVRMKDVHELIGSINIGSSGHHIISQGEADRYLNANIKDRRVLIEEALGLKVYQYRIKESERKLAKALENKRESELLRREIAPHLRFLKKQVDKTERTKELRKELAIQYHSYFAQEDFLIHSLSKKLDEERAGLQEKFTKVNSFLEQYGNSQRTRDEYPEERERKGYQSDLDTCNQKIRSQEQQLGRIQGSIDVLERQQRTSKKNQDVSEPQYLSFTSVSNEIKKVIALLGDYRNGNTEVYDEIVSSLHSIIDGHTASSKQPELVNNHQEIQKLMTELGDVQASLKKLQEQRVHIQASIDKLDAAIAEKEQKQREQEREYYEKLAVKKELDGKRNLLVERDEALGHRVRAFKEEREEATVLLGKDVLNYQKLAVGDHPEITQVLQEKLRREIERVKIRIEDMGGGSGADVIKEYEETKERDEFLENEISDVVRSVEQLESVIQDLKEKLNTEFDKGMQKINDQFNRFFRLMFGGGSARLEEAVVVRRRRKSDDDTLPLEEEDDKELGVDIKVKLPRKKVSDLDMLSGGERSLTSIALLFALSQVNPPPFLVLDETDAALDEANSQKYGDMVEQLSKFSQLIVVTHNRETMSRAQTLFGVTLGRDDSSATVSLRLEDAAKYAK